MTPPSMSDLRRQLWRARVNAAALVAPQGLTVAQGALPPGQGRAVTESELRDAYAAARAEYQSEMDAEAQRLRAVVDEQFAAAEERRSQGDTEGAADQLRQLLLTDAKNSRGWHLYALRLLESRNYDAAIEALKNTLTVNPGNLDALELLNSSAGGGRQRSVSMDQAFAGLADALKERPELHRRSLDFAIPSRLVECLNVLRVSQDAVTRAVVQQWDLDAEAESSVEADRSSHYSQPSWLSHDEYLVAQLLYSLQRGRRSRAIALIRMLPDQTVSRWSLRLAIRRDLRTNRLKGAQRLLTEYRRLEPEDGWAKSQEMKLSRSTAPSNYQLARQGFPFPHRRKSVAFEPIPDRIFYLLHNSLPYHSAGYSTRTHGLLTGLRRLGWDVRGVTRLGYPYDMPKMADLGAIDTTDVVDGVPYHRLSTTPGIEKKSPITDYVVRYYDALAPLAKQERPFVIHGASNHWNGLAAVTAANRLGLPSIYEVRGLWEVTRGSRDPEWAKGGMYRFMARMEADAASEATRVFAITNALKEELVNRGVDPDKITVVPNAVDAERFTPQPRDTELEKSLELVGRTVIGYIGSVLDYEGLGMLVDAADVMRTRRQDFAALIVGDGAELEKFQELVRERDLEEFVRFTGRVPHEDVERYYSLVDIAPFPRLPLPVCEMVSPLKPFEALAMGKAVVASDVAALAEIIQPGVNGLLHRKGDVEDLTRQLEVLLDDQSLREELAEKGRHWVRENRQWSDMARIVSDIYEDLGGRRVVGNQEQD
ncbi:glycosyltransferase [Kocuria carniphila]|uniref:glycosyltransferase n=1 Tax=Kocuria carniphila TaxID=262208 RepID=UPI0034D00EAB